MVEIVIYNNAGNWHSAVVNFTVDATPPSVNILTPSEGSYHNSSVVNVEWVGDGGVSGIAHYEIRWNNMDWFSLGLDTSYELTSLDEGAYTVYVRAHDLAGNQFTTIVTFIIDRTPPEIIHTPSPRWHMEDTIVIQATVTDNFKVANVTLHYRYNDIYRDMNMVNIGGNTFRAELVALNMECTLFYSIRCVDGAGTVNQTLEYYLPVLDLNPPEVGDICQGDYDVMPVNGTVVIRFTKPMDTSITGDIGIISPDASYTLHWVSSYNLTVQFSNLNTITEYTFTLNRTLLVDIHGIPLDVDLRYVFTSQGYPSVEPAVDVEDTLKGMNITVDMEVKADTGIESVILHYNDTSGTWFQLDAVYIGDNIWRMVIPGQNRTGEVRYMVFATDSSGLVGYGGEGVILITNPSMVYPPADIIAEAGKPFDFTIRVTSPSGVIRVVLYYTCPERAHHSRDLMLQGGNLTDGIWGCRLNLEQGDFVYQLEILDGDGESIILPVVPATFSVQGKTAPLGGYLLYFLLVLAACGVVGGGLVLWKKKRSGEDEPEPEMTAPAVTDTTQAAPTTQQFNTAPCTICFGQVEEPESSHRCTNCGNLYHKSCLYELGECPVCGMDPLAGVKDVQT